MFKDSKELLEYAIRLLDLAERYHQYYVGIKLAEEFPNDLDEISNLCNKLELDKILGIVREKFSKYEIRSDVRIKVMNSIEKSNSLYPLEWEITLRRKK